MVVRVALYGFGKVGQQATALLAQRAGVELVAVIGRSNAGEAVSSMLTVERDAAAALARTRPDVVLHATVPNLDDALPQITVGLEAGCRVVSTCEELAYPWV